MCWTIIERGGDYALVRQSLTDKKLRAPELAEQAEHAYRRPAKLGYPTNICACPRRT